MNRRVQIIDAIRLYKQRHGGNSPSEEELSSLIGISRQAVNKHLARMERDGQISRPGRGRRAIELQPEQINL